MQVNTSATTSNIPYTRDSAEAVWRRNRIAIAAKNNKHCNVREELHILPGNWRSDGEASAQHPRKRRDKTYEDCMPADYRTRGGKRK